jgi:RHS repeat-associated protein
MKNPKPTSSGRQAVGHPIDVASGVLFHEIEDYVVPGRMPLRWSRRYSSALLGKTPIGMFGPCWASPYEARLVRDLDGYAMVALDGETLVTFDDWQEMIVAGGVVRNHAAFHELRRDGLHLLVTKWIPEEHQVERLRFEPTAVVDAYRLCSWETVDGQAVDVLYDKQGRIEQLRQRREGRAFILIHDSRGHVTQVRLAGRTGLPEASLSKRDLPGRLLWTYRYDETGRLREAEDALEQRCTYDYDEAGRLIREVTLGGMVYHFRYDAKGRCIESVGLDGYARTTLKIDALARMTQVINTQDNVSSYVWNEGGQVEMEISPLGHKKQWVYDGQARLTKRISPSGGATAYEYDAQGDLSTVTQPTGSVTRFEHDERHLLVAVVDAAGFRWERGFDERGRLSWVQNPKGQRTTYTHGPLGDLIERTSPLGHRYGYGWDPAGNLHSVRDASGYMTQYEHDEEGQLTAVIEPGPRPGLFGKGARTELVRDALGRVREVRLPDGATRKFTYHPTDQITQYIDENRAVTRWRYLPCGILTEEVKPLGMRVQYHWGPEPGQLETITNEAGERHTFEYDGDGRVLAETDFGGRRTTYRYDQDGNVVGKVNAAGQAIHFVHDASGALLQATYPDGTQINLAYDPRGLLLRAENPDTLVERTYDELGRLQCEQQGRHEVRNQYDSDGRRIRRSSSLGYEVLFEWTPNDQLSVLHPRGQDAIHFDYAPDGSELLRYVPYGVRIEQRHDLRGRMLEQAAGVRDPVSGHVRVGESANVHRIYKYDPAGNVLDIQDACWGETRYSYDANGRITSRADTGRWSERFEYDPADNLRGVGEFRSDPTTRLPQRAQIAFTYRRGNQLERVNGTVYEYDAVGQPIKKTDGKGVTRYEWNAQGLLARVFLPDGVIWHYRYDAFARRIAKQGQADRTEFVWDGDVVLHEIRAAGNPTPEAVHWEFEPGGFAPISKVERGEAYLCVNDLNGAPRELLNRSGRTVWAANLSTYGQPQEERRNAPNIDCPIRFQGQWHDQETNFHYNRFRYYDPQIGRYLSPDPARLRGGINQFIYPTNSRKYSDPYGLSSDEAFYVDPNQLRYTQNTAGGNGRADILRLSMGQHGYRGDPIDVVRTSHGLATIDNTRPAVAVELGISKIPARAHDSADLLPATMRHRFGNAKTWGDAVVYRTSKQRPPLPPTGTQNPPRLPRKNC